jgi:hypothetical protein
MDMKCTPEQLFMIMLKERIDKLEDNVLQLTNELNQQQELYNESNKSLFFYIKITLEESDEVLTQNEFDEYINEIFKNRKDYEPNFACWNNKGKDIYILFALDEPLLQKCMEQLLHSDKYVINTILPVDLALFKWYFYQNKEFGSLDANYDENIFFHMPDNHNFVEYWWRYTTDFETDQDLYPYMTDEPFTKSENYGRSHSVQEFLRKKIFIEHDWTDLLRLDYKMY